MEEVLAYKTSDGIVHTTSDLALAHERKIDEFDLRVKNLTAIINLLGNYYCPGGYGGYNDLSVSVNGWAACVDESHLSGSVDMVIRMVPTASRELVTDILVFYKRRKALTGILEKW